MALKAPPNEKLLRDAEREESRLCSLILRDASAMEKAVDSGIRYDWFWNSDCSDFYKLLAGYWFEHKCLVRMETFESLIDKGAPNPEAVTRKMSLYNEIYALMATLDELPYLISQVINRHAQRLISDHLQNWYDRIMKASSNQLSLAQQFVAEAQSLELPTGERKEARTENLSVLADSVLEEIIDRQENPDKYRGLQTGLRTIDRVFHGFQKQRSLVLLAPEGGGKTSAMLNFANNQAEMGHKVAYVTVESPAKDIEMRSLSRDARVDVNRILAGGRDEATGIRACDLQWVKDAAAKRKISHQNNLFYITADYDAKWTTIVKELDRLQASVKLDVIYVDYLDVIGRITTHADRPDLELGDLFKAMVNYGKANDIFMVTAMQLKADKVRELWKQARAGKEIFASTADVAGTRLIGGIADYMLLLMIDPLTRKRLKMYSMKARMAPSGEPFVLDYIPEMMLLRDAAEMDTCDKAGTMLEEDPALKDQLLKEVIAESAGDPRVSVIEEESTGDETW